MRTYTVIWRDNGDDYMFTTVTTDLHPSNIANNEWVAMSAAVEYAQWDEEDRESAILSLKEGYDLLDVLLGVPISVL
jgi:hypothetical protein